MGMSSEKLDGHTLELRRSTQTKGQSSPASGEKIQDRLLQVVVYQTTWEGGKGGLDIQKRLDGPQEQVRGRTIFQRNDDSREVLKENHVRRLARNV